jgi:hypothetical protein
MTLRGRMSLSIAAAFVVVAVSSAAAAQSVPPAPGAHEARQPTPAQALKECGKAGPGTPCQLVVDRLAPVSGRSATVEGNTHVTVVLQRKSPFESCRNEVKREELPDVSVVPSLLALVKDLAGPLVLAAGTRTPKTTADRIAARLDELMQGALDRAESAARLRARYESEAGKLTAFYRTVYYKPPGGEPGGNEAAFNAERAERYDAAVRLEHEDPPAYAVGEAAYRKLADEYLGYAASAGAAGLHELEAQIDLARRALDALARAVAALEAARVKLRSTIAYLQTLEHPEWEVALAIHPDRNARVSGTIGCTSDVTGKPTLDPPVVYAVRFQDTPRLSLTAGILVSWVPRNSIGVEPVVDSRTGSEPSAHQEIVAHPSRPQAIPFSFLNVRVAPPLYWSGRRVTFSAAPGFGVNSNNGDVSAEFFFGGSVGIDSFFATVGWHVGHEVIPANGYQVGDHPPTTLTEVPVETPWKANVSFAVSYRIPLR